MLRYKMGSGSKATQKSKSNSIKPHSLSFFFRRKLIRLKFEADSFVFTSRVVAHSPCTTCSFQLCLQCLDYFGL